MEDLVLSLFIKTRLTRNKIYKADINRIDCNNVSEIISYINLSTIAEQHKLLICKILHLLFIRQPDTLWFKSGCFVFEYYDDYLFAFTADSMCNVYYEIPIDDIDYLFENYVM